MPDWMEILNGIGQLQSAGNRAHDMIRRQFLEALFKRTNRNVIAYYSGWLSKPGLAQLEINDEDKNGFMMAVHGLDRKLGLDLILHTPGGGVGSTQSIVNYLRKMFGTNIRAIVPQIAMSAGTMLACSCKEIMMGKHSNLGPIDPHLRGVPAWGIVKEFKRALREVKANPSTAMIWQQIISQYRPAFLSQCENAIQWSRTFVEEQLEACMFAGNADAKKKAKTIARALSDYSENKSHERHIHAEECKEIGLVVSEIETDPALQDLILSVHHCYTHTLMNTPAFKIIENHKGAAIIKQQQSLAFIPNVPPNASVPPPLQSPID
jgi:ClpP class serine protease